MSRLRERTASPPSPCLPGGRLTREMFASGLIDLASGVPFIVAYLRTAPSPGSPLEESRTIAPPNPEPRVR